MNFYTDDHPIIACSTGSLSNTAIAVIRLSGFDSLISLQPYFSYSLLKIKPRFSHLTNILNDNLTLDNCLMVFFPKGESYTGENVLEISVHGNLLNIQNILELFIEKADFRSAHPGEFTFRALKNKKLTLSQVEGLDMLLNANSNLMLSQGLDVLQGELHSQYLRLYESYLKLKSAVEISIDFSEDVGESETKNLLKSSFDLFFNILDSLHSRTQGSVSSLLSPDLVLVGQTNAGKSSLFNLLVKHNRSIVSPIAGTTRDYVSEVIQIDRTNYHLIDTAGIRDSIDPIENIGIERAFDLIKKAFFKILIINPFESNPQYIEKLQGIHFDLLIISHADKSNFTNEISHLDLSNLSFENIIAASFKSGSIEPLTSFGPIEPVKILGPIEPVKNLGPIEPVKNLGPIEPVKNLGPIEPAVKKLLSLKFKNHTSNSPILLERHRTVLNKIYLKTSHLSNEINSLNDSAILSSEVNILGYHLSELIGVVSPDDVLNSIFSNFCIGK
jgi:tRNA modification GTPase